MTRFEKYEQSLKLRPDYVIAWTNWGAALGTMGRHEEAIEKFKQAIKYKPDYAAAWYSWGYALNRLGWKRQAFEKLKKAKELGYKP